MNYPTIHGVDFPAAYEELRRRIAGAASQDLPGLFALRELLIQDWNRHNEQHGFRLDEGAR